MKTVKVLIASMVILLFASCGDEKSNNVASFKFENATKNYKLGETINFSVEENGGSKIDSLKYNFQSNSKAVKGKQASISLNNMLLGKHNLTITYFMEGVSNTYSSEITILNNAAPQVYSFEILNEYPHNTADYTQGLEFNENKLYESAGKYGESRLLQKELETGAVLKEHKLSKTFFAEGLTIVADKIHQLTWKGDMGFTYNLEDFKTIGTFAYKQSKQGWGLCYDGNKTIYKSDGTTRIWKLNSETLEEEGFIQIATNKSLKSRFNELEWVDGKIYANTWQKDSIAIINPENGAIEAIINLNGIRKEVNVNKQDNDKVLNGIAYNKKNNKLYITGKYWSKLFEIKVIK